MNDPWIWLTVTTGLLVRIGVPALLLVVTVWVLRRLDVRWQAEAKRPAPRPTPPEPPCWEARACAPDRRVQCAAYLNPETPCWQQFRDRDGNLRTSCLVCDFFAAVPVPEPARAAQRM